VVYYERIAFAFTDAGMLAPEIRELADVHLKFAKVLSPSRTGRMRREHYKHIGPAKGFSRPYYVGTHATYARFVLLGTAGDGAGFITPKKGKELELRPVPYSYFAPGASGRFRTMVRGQHHQDNWLRQAGAEAIAFFGLGRARFPGIAQAAGL
jgi:hypothetical protein